jgi:hypothetical protein
MQRWSKSGLRSIAMAELNWKLAKASKNAQGYQRLFVFIKRLKAP